MLAPRTLGRAIGLEGRERLLRMFGLREIGAGMLVLTADDPRMGLWARVAGDGLDGAVLAAGLMPINPHRGRTLIATLAVAPVVILDALYARKRTV